ncbi:transcriptional adapter 2-alpha [Lepeophtheirus salmonis]|uniref:transcriptional adapter 2-alpha n=1 Tax=Lepeophtheirus salmonis TaxID=72036 RepID=UPI001AE7423F|nr:transcriptional adapter 2-alpha-like [Lepeophtheirus salmonis]
MEETVDYGCCQSCHLVLHDPFIECHTCKEITDSKTYICLDCYSKGKEFAKHVSNHAYSVVKQDFSLFSHNWTAKDELQLLDAVLHHGLGSWEEVSKTLTNKTPSECEAHFAAIFIEDKKGEFKELTSKFVDRFSRDQPVPYIQPQKEQSLLYQIRPPPSVLSKELAGYNPARGDFETELDDLAENDLNSISYNDVSNNLEDPKDEDDALFGKLELSALFIYNDKLKERKRIKSIVKEHGLINKRSAVALSSTKYPLIREKYGKVYDFRRLFCSLDFDYILEGLQHEFQIKRKVRKYQEFRSNGLTNKDSTIIYKKLKVQREMSSKELSSDRVWDWVADPRNISYVKDKLTGKLMPTTNAKKQAVRLDITGLTSFEKLSSKEQDLCSEIRMAPESFLQIKTTMINECKKSNGLRLADARPVVKIDVNKTRKIYDLLINDGVIYRN